MDADDKLNDIRCLCHEMIIKLMEGGAKQSLEMLRQHIEAALDRLNQSS